MPAPNYDLREVSLESVRTLCEQYHGYGSAGRMSVYSFGVFENDVMVAGYSWNPPPPGAASAICPEAPFGVLALSRMVATPRETRKFHVSKPLRRQMRQLIDRTRWPVLVTYSDSSLNHTGYVYKCSGWEETGEESRRFYTDSKGKRASSYSNGASGKRELTFGGNALLKRWEHWICPRGQASKWMSDNGWRRVPIPGKAWRSGNQAYTYEKILSLD